MSTHAAPLCSCLGRVSQHACTVTREGSGCLTRAAGGWVGGQMAKNQLKKIELAQPIVEVAWDPRSDNYLLVAQADGRIALYDADTLQVQNLLEGG
jgi:WD40 repeat protein